MIDIGKILKGDALKETKEKLVKKYNEEIARYYDDIFLARRDINSDIRDIKKRIEQVKRTDKEEQN